MRFLTKLSLPLLVGSLWAEGGVANLSVRPEAQPKTVALFADFLYWHTSETVDWAFTLSTVGNSTNTSYKTFSFDWAPGFRVGLGYNMEHDQWDTRASYTWFQSKAIALTSGSVTPAFLSARLSLLEPFARGKASLNLHYNMFDWDLGRQFLVSEHLLIRPAIGLRGGWISQSIQSYWSKPSLFDLFTVTARERIKHRFKGGGPKGGISGKWGFGDFRKSAFSLIGEFEAGYLWGHWSIRDKFTDLFNTEINIFTDDRNFGSFVLHTFAGLGWDVNFNCDRSHFSFKVGYELEDWFNQFQIFSDTSGSQNNNLVLQGLTANLRLDF